MSQPYVGKISLTNIETLQQRYGHIPDLYNKLITLSDMDHFTLIIVPLSDEICEQVHKEKTLAEDFYDVYYFYMNPSSFLDTR